MGDQVKVTPQRLQVLIALGCSESTAETLEHILGLPMDEIIDALDGLIRAGVADDIDSETFFLTEHGLSLFSAVYDATGSVLEGSERESA
jgi:hypothetical protein